MPNSYIHLVEGDYLDIWQCNDCGAHADTVQEIKHYTACLPGELKKWQNFYEKEDNM